MEESSINKIKLIGSLVGVIILLAVGYVIYMTVTRQGKVAVDVVSAPGDALITLNDAKINSGTNYLSAGEYKVKATKNGFVDFSDTVFIKDGLSGQSIPILLTPASDEAKKWVDDNQDAYAEVEAAAGESAQKGGDFFREKNPIVKHLPTDSLLYSIGYITDTSDPTGNSIILEIDAPEGYRQAAIYQIGQWGYNPADFKINFKDYKNPFSS